MIITEPTYNIITPLNIIHILKNHSDAFMVLFKELLANTSVTSVRVQTSGLSSKQLIEVVDYIKTINERQALILIENNLELAKQLKIDGIHLTNGQKLVREARETLGNNQIIGAYCGTSKHSGLVAAEHGADYVAFKAEGSIQDGKSDNLELFKWWTEFIEIPVIAECSSDLLICSNLWKYCDFFSIVVNMLEPDDTIKALLNQKK